MKNFKKFAAMVSALALASCAIAPAAMNAFAETKGDYTGSITINDLNSEGMVAFNDWKATNSTTDEDFDTWLSIVVADTDDYFNAETPTTPSPAANQRTFEIYQILTADITVTGTDQKLANMKWGTGISAYGPEESSTAVSTGTLLTETEQNMISGFNEAELRDWVLNKVTYTTIKEIRTVGLDADSASFSGLNNGYYVIKDVTNLDNKDEANSAVIVRVVDGTAAFSLKKAKPSVDKQVSDNEDDTTSWGESADHAINETFQFKLIASIPGDADLQKYTSYVLTFNDSFSKGIAWDGVYSVKIMDGDTELATLSDGYIKTDPAITNGIAASSWSLTVNDVIASLGNSASTYWGKKDFTVEVIYNVHLTEYCNKAKASSTGSGKDATDVNWNDVDLSYSNNPDSTGTGTSTGKTEKDTVWVFTYEMDNTKYAESEDGAPLKGAKFRLYSNANCTNEIELYKVGDDYYPKGIKSDVEAAEMESEETTGKFNILGLDYGTYYLKEIDTVSGYNKLTDAIKVEIIPKHGEKDDGSAATLTFIMKKDDERATEIKVVNKQGSALPSTGGIGTTLFYLGGGTMVAVAGVFLITKKRMGKREE